MLLEAGGGAGGKQGDGLHGSSAKEEQGQLAELGITGHRHLSRDEGICLCRQGSRHWPGAQQSQGLALGSGVFLSPGQWSHGLGLSSGAVALKEPACAGTKAIL